MPMCDNNKGDNMTTKAIEKLTIEGVTYVPESTVTPAPTGTRAVIVVDSGWVFAGDVTRENGRVILDRAIHVRGWDSVGFDGMIANPKDPKVRLKPMSRIDIPESAELFCVPAGDSWGL